MAGTIDNLIALHILKLLVTPFNKMDAYKLGIIDEKGTPLKKSRDLKTEKEQAAYTLLHRLVFRLKRIINRVPLENKQFLSFAAALALIKECYDNNKEPIELESIYLEYVKRDHDISLVETFMSGNYRLTFKQYLDEEGGAAIVSTVPANNAAVTAGVAGLERDAPNVPVAKKNKLTKQLFRRKKLV